MAQVAQWAERSGVLWAVPFVMGSGQAAL